MGGRGSKLEGFTPGVDGGSRGKDKTERGFVVQVNRLRDGNKMSFDIMLENFRESFTNNDELDAKGRKLSSYEHLIAIDDDGYAHLLNHGNRDSVSYLPSQVKGKTIIHNHPNDATFSRADLRGLERDGIKGIVASGKSGDYIFKLGKDFKYKEFDNALTNSPVTDQVSRKQGENSKDAMARVNRETLAWLRQNAKNYNYTIEYRKRKTPSIKTLSVKEQTIVKDMIRRIKNAQTKDKNYYPENSVVKKYVESKLGASDRTDTLIKEVKKAFNKKSKTK